jgi:hypothetical protein
MKIKIVCPNCNGYLEKEVDEKEVHDNIISCGKCRVPAIIYSVETEEIISGAPYIPGVVICAENTAIQVIIPSDLGKEDTVYYLRAIADAIESDDKEAGLIIANVAISLQEDRMIIIKASSECLGAEIDRKDAAT